MTQKEKLIDLIIDAKRADPETGSFTEYLADYLLENGVIVLPCEVGDIIYEICDRRRSGKWEQVIKERVVHGLEVGMHGSIMARCGTTVSVFMSGLGETVFLTHEEAEKALAERRGI